MSYHCLVCLIAAESIERVGHQYAYLVQPNGLKSRLESWPIQTGPGVYILLYRIHTIALFSTVAARTLNLCLQTCAFLLSFSAHSTIDDGNHMYVR